MGICIGASFSLSESINVLIPKKPLNKGNKKFPVIVCNPRSDAKITTIKAYLEDIDIITKINNRRYGRNPFTIGYISGRTYMRNPRDNIENKEAMNAPKKDNFNAV